MDDLISRQDAIEGKMNLLVRCDDDKLRFKDYVPVEYLQNMPSAEPVIRCKDCRWGREVCGNIECFVDSNIPPEYHGYEWFCPNGELKDSEPEPSDVARAIATIIENEKDMRVIAQPVRKGKWIYHEALECFECSVCGRQMVRNIFDFCPWCGASMSKGEEND